MFLTFSFFSIKLIQTLMMINDDNDKLEMSNPLYFDVDNADPEDQVLQSRIILLKKMLTKAAIDKERQFKILYGHLQRKEDEQQQQQQKKQETTSTRLNINNFRESVNIDSGANGNGNNGIGGSEGNKKQKKQINDNSSGSGYSGYSGGYYHQPAPPPIISNSLKGKFEKYVKKYEKSKQLLGLSESVVEFDRGFFAIHSANNDRGFIVIQSPDAESNSSFLKLIQSTESTVAYYQYEHSAKKRKYNKLIQQLKREYNMYYHPYSRETEEHFQSLSSIGATGATKYINYRRDKLGDLARINISFRNLPIFENLESNHSATIIFYHRILFYFKILNHEKDEYLKDNDQDGGDDDGGDKIQVDQVKQEHAQEQENQDLNGMQKSFLYFLNKVINSSDPLINITQDSEAEVAIGNLLMKICNLEYPPQSTNEDEATVDDDDDDDDDLAKQQQQQKEQQKKPLIHLVIDDLPYCLVDIFKILNNNIKVDQHKMYITASCRFKVPADKVVQQTTRFIRLSNPNFYQNINYLDHCIEPLAIQDDGFNPHDYPNIYRALQFIGGQYGLNKYLASAVRQLQAANPKTHVKNIVLDDILVLILNSLKNQQQQQQQQQQSPTKKQQPTSSVFLLDNDNQDIPLLVLLSIVGYNFKEAVNKFPQIEDYFCKGAITIQNNSICMAPLLMKYYLEYSINFTSFHGNVYQKAYNILKRFSTETYIWSRFYQEFYELKTLAYDVLYTNYPNFNNTNGKLTIRSLFYPNQKLNAEFPDDKTINYNDHSDFKDFIFKFVVESNCKKSTFVNHDTGHYDRDLNFIGNTTFFIPSPPNLEFFTDETEKTVKNSIKSIPSPNELVLLFTRKYHKISNTPHFKIINPIECNYFSCFTSFVDSIEL